MDKKIKTRILKSIHALYVESYQTKGSLEATPDKQFEDCLYKSLDSASGYQETPQEKEVTILMSDLRGFTSLSERHTPLEIIDLLNRYFAAMTEIINQHDGTIDKFMGDAIMVVFGSPLSQNNDLKRALSCAVDMQRRLKQLNDDNKLLNQPPLYMGIGINTGKVVAGKLGSDLYNEFTVIGDHVNLAARIESYSLRGQILLSQYTYKLAKDYISVGSSNTLQVKGKQQSIKMYELYSIDTPEKIVVPEREGRNSPRIDVNMALNFRLVKSKHVDETLFEGKIIDLAYGGMYISSEQQLKPFSEITFPLSLSLSANVHTDVYAKVIRVSPQEDAYHYHLEFSSISEEAETAIRNYINRIIERT